MKNKIMIVDDDPDILITLSSIFEEEGFEVFTVDSGKDCIRELQNGFEGIILMDLMMPFMDGWDTIKEIINKKLTENIKISILTAKDKLEKRQIKEVQPFIHDYVLKPFEIDRLIKNVKNMSKM